MRNLLLLAFGCLSSLFLSSQNPHSNYFFKTLNAERGATLCLDPSGNIWLGTREQGRALLIKTQPDGTVLDRVYLNLPGGTGTSDNLAEILVDSEGMIVGCGTSSEFFDEGFAFRYNPADRQLLWANTFESLFSNVISGIMENGVGGHFTAVSTTLGGAAELISFDRTTGKLRPANTRKYQFGGDKTFNSALLHNENFYAVGSDIDPQKAGAYLSTSKIAANSGEEVWTRHTPRTPIVWKGDMIGQDIIVDRDTLVSAVQGGPFGTTLLTHTLLHKRTLDGALLWAKRYALYGPEERVSVVVEEVANVTDGYVLFGRTFDGGPISSAFFLIKTDKNGQPKWARLLGKNWNVGVPLLNYQNQILATDDALYILADARDENALQRTYFIKTDLNGNVEGCDYIQPIGVQAFDLTSATASQIANLNVGNSNVLVKTVSVTPQIGAAPSFSNLCEAKALCSNLPDAVLNLSEVRCSGGVRTAHFSLCNLGLDTLRGDVSLGFYPKNPLKDSTQRVGSLHFSANSLAPGACTERSEPLVALGINDYPQAYALVGAANDVATPISISSFPLGNSAPECNYANNLTTWKLDVKAPTFSLGPDLSICPGKTAILSAGPGAVDYRWQDGSTSASFTAGEEGWYWVEITDICGGKQRDSVRVTLLPIPTRTQTVQFVEGGSVIIGGTVYTQPDTFSLTVPSVTGGCDSLITYRLQWVPAEVKINCPANLTTAIPLGQNTATVHYALPTASTNCPNTALKINLLEGPPPSSNLVEGTVKVCYEATDSCNARSTCCFNVTVNAAPLPCEVKTSDCIRYELFALDVEGNTRVHRLRVVNNCSSALQTLNFQLPLGLVAAAPADGSVYTAPSGRKYDVRNASATPFYSLRFKAKTGGIPTGQSDYFEYKLPNQIAQGYFLVFSRLTNGETKQAHMATFNCLSEAASAVADASDREGQPVVAETIALQVSPNPTSGEVSLWLPESWQGKPTRVSVLNAQGQLVQVVEMPASDAPSLALNLEANLSQGLYHLIVQTADGQHAVARCVKK